MGSRPGSSRVSVEGPGGGAAGVTSPRSAIAWRSASHSEVGHAPSNHPTAGAMLRHPVNRPSSNSSTYSAVAGVVLPSLR